MSRSGPVGTTTARPGETTAAWGQRLSDAIRAALDAGDLGRARGLVLEGDGQARSLDKEYALMYRGLGLTIRVLLDLLASLPPRGALGALLGRFRVDMLELMARAGAMPPREDAPEPSTVAEGIERTRGLLALGEDVFAHAQARLARDVAAAIDAGDAAGARRLVDLKEREQYLPLHDRLIRLMAETFAYVLREFGAEELLRVQRATAEGQRAGFEKWERMPAAEFARVTAFLLKQHMGQVEVREDAEKFTVVQTPCGSGGRLRLAGAYEGEGALPFVEGPGPLTLGQARFPVYCSHCPVWNALAPVEWFGRPHWVFDDPARPDGSCTLHVYKRRDGAPREYLDRLGCP